MKKTFYFLMAFTAIVFASCGEKKEAAAVAAPPVEEGYKIGDYYNDGTKEGIIFSLSKDKKRGKILSLNESTAKWASRAVSKRETDATSDKNGMTNLNEIKNMSNWESNYPAFAWCASLGEGWYLPASDELGLICDNRDAINKTLNDKGYDALTGWYWSSTEMDNAYSWGYQLSKEEWSNIGSGYNEKHVNCSVRAVAAF